MITFKTNQTNKISVFIRLNRTMRKMSIILIKSQQNRSRKINAQELHRVLENQGKDQQ